MANAKISALTSATTPVGTEVLPLVQSGATTKITINAATGITRPFSSNGVVYASSTTALVTGTALVFNGSSFSVGTTAFDGKFNVSNSGAAGFEFFVNAPSGGVGTYVQSFNRSGGAYIETHYYASSHTWRTNTSATSMILATTGIVTMSAYGAGAATFSAAGVISSVSDETWKIKDGVPVDPDTMLKKLQPGYWYYNDEKKETYGAERQLGFYAQNVNAAIGPEAAPEPSSYTNVDSDGNETTTTRPWGYYDRSVLAVTVMSLQKALATIESLTARIEALEAKIPA
jgi:hypothetical protein